MPARPAPTTPALGPDFAAPVDDRWFEDYVEGSSYTYGWISLTEDEIIDYAMRFDPQPFHIDPEYARASQFGGIIASGWHTSGVCMRMFADHFLTHNASLASPGIDEIRWPAPVRPGDELRLRVTVGETRVSNSKPDRGLMTTHSELLNADDVVVMVMKAKNFVARRPA
jgi:acyl dehydratase